MRLLVGVVLAGDPHRRRILLRGGTQGFLHDPARRPADPGRDQGGAGRLVLHAPEVRGQVGLPADRAGDHPGDGPRAGAGARSGPEARRHRAGGNLERAAGGRRTGVRVALGTIPSIWRPSRRTAVPADDPSIVTPCPHAAACSRHRGAAAIRDPTVSRFYGVGVQIILATIVVASAICYFGAGRAASAPPRGGGPGHRRRSRSAPSGWRSGRAGR